MEGISIEKPVSKKKTSLVGITYLINYNYGQKTEQP
jgi:hypothetical protein